ncbi:MAG: hypothetical protein NPINA01_28560 [Nitrospinaceae bacterium]|nr:MAG: hypothetical protein NPINA01_28560 [Nitrospinaceae bacterium]
MNGLVFIPRMIDKARAFKQNSLGGYIFPCPLDKIILEFLKIDSDEWARLADSKNEEQISEWLEASFRSRQPQEIESINKKILERQPDSEDRWKHFFKTRDKIDSSRTDVTTWVDLIDLEEGRLKAK